MYVCTAAPGLSTRRGLVVSAGDTRRACMETICSHLRGSTWNIFTVRTTTVDGASRAVATVTGTPSRAPLTGLRRNARARGAYLTPIRPFDGPLRPKSGRIDGHFAADRVQLRNGYPGRASRHCATLLSEATQLVDNSVDNLWKTRG